MTRRPVVRLHLAGKEAKDCALATPIGANETSVLTLTEGEGEIREHIVRTKRFGTGFGIQHWWGIQLKTGAHVSTLYSMVAEGGERGLTLGIGVQVAQPR